MVFQKGQQQGNQRFTFLEDSFEGSGNRVDSKWVLTRAVDRIHAICAYGQSERQGVLQELPRRISLGATMLEALVSPIEDDVYRTEIAGFWSRYEETQRINQQRGIATDVELDIGLFKFAALVRLIDRHNLLYERYMKDYILPPSVKKVIEEKNKEEEIKMTEDERVERILKDQENPVEDVIPIQYTGSGKL